MAGWGWLRPGNDRELAATRYAGQESATDKAGRKAARLPKPARNAAAADRAGSRWQTGACADGTVHTGRCRH